MASKAPQYSPRELKQFKRDFKNALATDGFEVHLMKKEGDPKHKLLRLTPGGDLELVGKRGLSNIFSETRKIPTGFKINAAPIGNTSIIRITDDMGENNWVLGAKPEDRDALLAGLASLNVSSPRSSSEQFRGLSLAKPIHLVEPVKHRRRTLAVFEENMAAPSSSSKKAQGKRRVYLGEEGSTPRATVFFNKDASDMEEFPAYRPTSGTRRSSFKQTSSYGTGMGLRRTKRLKKYGQRHEKKKHSQKHGKKRRGKGTRKH